MNGRSRALWVALGLVAAWRLALLVFTAQPVPANDAYFFDGAAVHWLLHGQYFNPSLAEAFPISGHQVFAAYPPLYPVALSLWMRVFGPSALSAMGLHWVMFCLAGGLALLVVRATFPAGPGGALALLFLLGVTFDDRPEGLAHIFGLAALLLTARGLDGKSGGLAVDAAIAAALLGAIFTSPVVGALYFGAGFLSRVAARCFGGRRLPIFAFVLAAAVFGAVVLYIARAHPLLWNGFLENSRQTPLVTDGFRVPSIHELIKLVRTAPVFLLAFAGLPCLLVWRWRKAPVGKDEVAWLSLTLGVAVMGAVLLVAAMVLLSPNYVQYVLFAQVPLVAGLFALGAGLGPRLRFWLSGMLVGALALLSVRAVGMTTWGVVCANDVSYRRAQHLLQEELRPFTNSDKCVIVSSAFLYSAAQMGVSRAIHSDWSYDRRTDTPEADFDALLRLRPPKLLLTQPDFHRAYRDVVEHLRQHPEFVAVRVRDSAGVRTPDSIPSLQRVVQHISWAPVVVDLEWK